MFAVRLLAFLLVVCTPIAAAAHPLGNFTTNHLVHVSADGHTVHLRYVLDNAEIPTFAILRELDSHGTPSSAELTAWSGRFADTIRRGLDVDADALPLDLRVVRATTRLRPGAGGLATLYATFDFEATLPVSLRELTVRDATFPGKIGWKDIVVGTALEPTHDLTRYPNALAGSPRSRSAVVLARSTTGALVLRRAIDGTAVASMPIMTTRSNALSDMLGQNLLDPRVFVIALLVAIGLGALHALEPGHGKTLLAVSLVGARANVGQAMILAGSLTAAHTTGVIIFGILVLSLSRYIVPETLYPWVALTSGCIVAVIGARALAAQIGRRHLHADGHAHAHLDDEAHARAHALPGTAPLGFRAALVAATTGNLAPCPAALVVLLAAINTHHIAVGLTLIVAFSIGLAGTLTGIGIAVVRSASWLTRRPHFEGIAHIAPLFTALAMSSIGAWMVGEAFVAQGITVAPIAGALLVALAVLGYAFSAAHGHGHAHAPPAIPEVIA